MIKMFIGNEEVVSNHEFTIKEEMLSASSTILNNCYPREWELTKDYVSNFYYPKDYSKFILASGEFEHGTTEYSLLEATCKNLFSYQQNTLYKMNINPGDMKIVNDNACNIGYIKCKPNTTYTVSRNSPMAIRFYVATTSEMPANNVPLLSVITIFNATLKNITITTPANANYLVIRFIYNEINDYEQYARTVQIEEGETATSYVPYGEDTTYETNVEKNWDSLSIEGNTTQKTATEERGKNLLYLGSLTSGISGLTITKTGNSSITINGTAGSTGYIAYSLLHGATLTNQTYCFSIRMTSSVNNSLGFALSQLTGLTNLTMGASSTYVSASSNSLNNKIPTALSINVASGTVFQNVSISFQLEQNNSATTFEEATYTPPMPSPDRPSELVSVGYENLTQLNNYTNNVSNVYFVDRKLLDNFENDTTYTLSFDITSTIEPFRVSIGYGGGSFQADGPNIANQYNGHISLTFTANNSTYSNLWIRIPRYATLTTYQTDVKNMILVKGSEEKPFIPYGKYGIEVKNTGKNLFDIENTNWTLFNASYPATFDNVNNGWYNKAYMSTTIVPEETQTFSFDVKKRELEAGEYNYSTNWVIRKDGSAVAWGTGADSNIYVRNSYTMELGHTYIFQIYNHVFINNVQLEKGNQATTYEAYKENTQLYILDNPLRSVGNYKDRLYIQNGMLYVNRNVGSVILNGSETGWTYQSNNKRFYKYFTDINLKNVGEVNTADVLTTYFAPTTTLNIPYTVVHWSNALFFYSGDMFSTTSDATTWLGNHNTEVVYPLAIPYTEELGKVNIPYSFEGQNNVFLGTGTTTTVIDLYYYWKNYDTIFAGIIKNSGDISLNPRYPHYCSLQILDYKTFLSESDTLDYVISNKTIAEAIQMVVDTVSDYGFQVGTIDISSADDIIGAYSTLNKTAYDVLQYLAEISGSRWRARYIDNSSMAIDFYDPDTLPQGQDIEYTKEYWEDNNVVDLTFNYGTRDYRNKQIILSDEVYAGIDYNEVLLSNGYNTSFITSQNVGIVKEILVNGVSKEVITQQEKDLGADADFYYTPGKNIIESASSYTAGTQIGIIYTPLVKGRQIVFNNDEVGRIATQTDTIGVISRYESRNDIVSSAELEQIAETYIEYKGKAEIILTLTTMNNDLYNVGEVVYFNAPIEELQQKYMVKSKETQYIIENENGTINLFYVYELTSSFNSEKAINYFDNQRNKAQGNIQEGQSITRNIDINSSAVIIWGNATISETSVSITGDNVLNSVLNSPFVE